MPKIVRGSPFDVDWTNKVAVIAYAKKFGPGMVVIKHSGRKNYNICHASRRDRWDIPGVRVVYRT